MHYTDREEIETIPFLLLVKDDYYEIYKYLPRYFQVGQTNPNDADTMFAVCYVKRTFPLRPFMAICEAFMKQTLRTYNVTDNGCVPGSFTN
jgi:hypothetical protein